MSVERYDAITGKKLDKEKRNVPIEFYLAIGIITTFIVPLIGIIVGLYALFKGKSAEGVILLFVALIAYLMYMYGVL